MSQIAEHSVFMGWIHSLIDDGSLLPLCADFMNAENTLFHYGSEVFIALAKVDNRPIAIYAHNHTINRGYVTTRGAQKILRLMHKAEQLRIPIVAFLASPGIDLQENLLSGNEYTKIITEIIRLSEHIPQFALVMAPTLGAPAYSAVLMDFVLFNKHRSYLMVTSPVVVQQAIGEKTTMSELGSAQTHAKLTGIADFVANNIKAQIEQLQWLINFLPSHSGIGPERKNIRPPRVELPLIPTNPNVAFDMFKLIVAVVDHSCFHEYKSAYGCSIICGFAHINGHAVGIIANQSIRLSGAIDCDAAEKSAKFLKICNAYMVPIITFIDVPGFMPGSREEHKGLLKFGAAFCAAMQTRTARLSVIVRKCYGAAAFLMMQTESQGGDLVLALESAHVGVMGEKINSQVVQADRLKLKPLEQPGSSQSPLRTNCSLEQAYNLGLIDEIIATKDLRVKLANHLDYIMLKNRVKQS